MENFKYPNTRGNVAAKILITLTVIIMAMYCPYYTYGQNRDTIKGTKNTPKTNKAIDSAAFKKLKRYRIFTRSLQLQESNVRGDSVPGVLPTVQKGQGFEIVGVSSDGNLITKMWIWSLNKGLEGRTNKTDTILSKEDIEGLIGDNKTKSQADQRAFFKQLDIVAKRQSLNFKKYGYKAYAPVSISKPNDNIRYFKLPADTVDIVSTEYKRNRNWDINFGILTTPFKLRFNRFAFVTNAGIGTAVYFQKKFRNDWAWGFVTGFSLTSVTLDFASTNVHPEGTDEIPASNDTPTTQLKTSSTRPAFTPSLHFVISYKNINFTLGSGVDIISKPTNVATESNPEAGWIYNGKPWIGLGFGVSLFGNNSGAPSAQPEVGQKKDL